MNIIYHKNTGKSFMRYRPIIEPPEEDIKLLAYLAWEHQGKPEGKDIEIWFEAKQYLIDARQRYIDTLEKQQPKYKRY